MPVPRWSHPWIAGAAGALLFFLLSTTAMSGKSSVYDEGVHLLSGWRALHDGDRDFNHEHPPLMKALAAAPILLSGAAKPLERWEYRREYDEWPLSHAWLYHANDADRLLRLGRLPITLVGAAVAILVCAVAWTLAGPIAGGAAVLLFALEPNLLAHGSLITTDMGMTAFFVATIAAFRAWLERRTTGWAIATGALLGLALLAKFTAVAIVPILILLGIAEMVERRKAAAGASTSGDREARRRLRREAAPRRELREAAWKPIAASVAIMAGVALLVLNAGYAFDGTLGSLSAMKPESAKFRSLAAGPLGSLPIPAPRPWIAGFDHAEAGGQRWWSYLMGAHSMTGWRSYYLIALLVKTPIPLLLLALAGLFLAGRAGVGRGRLLALTIPPAALLAAFTFSGDLKNIGMRYILPVHPFLCILGGVAAAGLISWRRREGAAACALLLIWMAVGAWRIYPDHLTYFNEAAGGPRGGRWWLLDSNLDWGQDLKGLGAWIRSHDAKKIFVDYFGTACPRYYGVASDRDFEGGLLAVSATHLGGVYREDRTRYDFLAGAKPIAVIGRSIDIYDVPRPPGWTPLPAGSME